MGSGTTTSRVPSSKIASTQTSGIASRTPCRTSSGPRMRLACLHCLRQARTIASGLGDGVRNQCRRLWDVELQAPRPARPGQLGSGEDEQAITFGGRESHGASTSVPFGMGSVCRTRGHPEAAGVKRRRNVYVENSKEACFRRLLRDLDHQRGATPTAAHGDEPARSKRPTSRNQRFTPFGPWRAVQSGASLGASNHPESGDLHASIPQIR